MTPESAEAIEIAARIAVGSVVLLALAVFVWTVSAELRERERNKDDDRRR